MDKVSLTTRNILHRAISEVLSDWKLELAVSKDLHSLFYSGYAVDFSGVADFKPPLYQANDVWALIHNGFRDDDPLQLLAALSHFHAPTAVSPNKMLLALRVLVSVGQRLPCAYRTAPGMVAYDLSSAFMDDETLERLKQEAYNNGVLENFKKKGITLCGRLGDTDVYVAKNLSNLAAGCEAFLSCYANSMYVHSLHWTANRILPSWVDNESWRFDSSCYGAPFNKLRVGRVGKPDFARTVEYGGR